MAQLFPSMQKKRDTKTGRKIQKREVGRRGWRESKEYHKLKISLIYLTYETS